MITIPFLSILGCEQEIKTSIEKKNYEHLICNENKTLLRYFEKSWVCRDDINRAKEDLRKNGELQFFINDTINFDVYKRSSNYIDKISKPFGIKIQIWPEMCLIYPGQINACYELYMNMVIDSLHKRKIVNKLISTGDSIFILNNLNETFGTRRTILTKKDTRAKGVIGKSQIELYPFFAEIIRGYIRDSINDKEIISKLQKSCLYTKGIVDAEGILHFEHCRFGSAVSSKSDFLRNDKINSIAKTLKTALEKCKYLPANSYGYSIKSEFEEWVVVSISQEKKLQSMK